MRNVVKHDDVAAQAKLNPNFRYLRVMIDGRLVLLALGYVDSHPQGPVEVWYSAEREVLRLQNGRIVGASGSPIEWRSVSLPELPSWDTLARAGQPLHWVRSRDVMPGYRFGVQDTLSLRVVSAPAKSSLLQIDPQRLIWFDEQMQPARIAGRAWFGGDSVDDLALPTARYAVDLREGKSIVVYGEQCLAPRLCLTWQRWPAEPQGAEAK